MRGLAGLVPAALVAPVTLAALAAALVAALVVVVVAVVAVAALPSVAHAAGELPEATLPPIKRAPPHALSIAVQLDLDRHSATELVAVYGHAAPFALQARGAWLFEHRYGIGLGAALQRRRGTGVDPEGIVPSTVLWEVPVFLEGTLRLALFRKQLLVPYLRGGVGVVVWHEVATWSTDTGDAADAADAAAADGAADAGPPSEPDEVLRWTGAKLAVHGGGGVQLRLPFAEFEHEYRMATTPLISALYVHLEGWGRSADNLGADGLDLSAFGVSLGLTMAF